MQNVKEMFFDKDLLALTTASNAMQDWKIRFVKKYDINLTIVECKEVTFLKDGFYMFLY